ncbi:MAG: SGNH/GDSL hydrolase family protein [Vicinamibacterales bacterium]
MLCLLAVAIDEVLVRWRLGYVIASPVLRLKEPPPELPVGYARYRWNRLRMPDMQDVESFDPVAVFGEETLFPPNLFRRSFRFSEQWSSNSYGFRGPEFTVEKPARTFRIVCLGGSTTEGIGVSNAETYPAQLQRALAGRQVDGRQIEVINAGFSGFGSIDLYHVFRSLVLPLSPDLVIYYEVGNRISETQFYERGPRTVRPVLEWISTHVALYRSIRQIVGAPPPWRQTYTFTEGRVTPSLEDYAKWVDRIVDLATERGIRMVLAEPVHGYRNGLWTNAHVPADVEWQYDRWQPILPEHIAKWYEATGAELERLARRRQLPWVPLRPCLSVERENFLYHNPVMYDPVHYSALGNTRIAQCLSTALVSGILSPV